MRRWLIHYCLKQDPTRLYKDVASSLPDATSSLKRCTRECSFREQAFLACWSAQGWWSSATQTGGNAARCVQSTRHGKNYHCCRAVPPARESSEERAQLVEFTRQQKSGAEWCNAQIRTKSWLYDAPAAYLYSRCDQRQLDAIIACQCALACLVYTQSGLVSLS